MKSLLRHSHRAVLPALPFALGSASVSHAAAVYTDAGDVTLTGAGAISWDMGSSGASGSASLGNVPGVDFTLSFGTTSGKTVTTDFNDPRLSINSSGSGFAINASSKAGVRKFNAGEMIDGFSSFDSGNYGLATSSEGSYGDWSVGSSGFAGLKFSDGGDTLYGWAQITYGTSKEIILHDFAYESLAGVGILAGDTVGTAIPEPGTTAAFAGLIAGSAAAFGRRRRVPITA